MNPSVKVGGIALLLLALFYLAGYALVSPLVGVEDLDNPVTSLVFIEQQSILFFSSGLAYIMAAILLMVASIAVSDLQLLPPTSMLMRVTSTLGLFAAAFFFVHGILRMQAPGTLGYIDSLNPDWGSAAYLALQIAGTQGVGSAGIFALSTWAVGLSLAGWRSRRFPFALSILGLIPTLPWVMGILSKYAVLPEGLYLVYIGSIVFGIPIWCIVMGIVLLRWKSPL